ncbi:MAG: alpha-amylase, partial [Muribaculaceae bacterium]|nr:alpha-amylase [Muribaculaceae bacterium]
DYGTGTRHYDPGPDTWLKMLHILRYWAAKGVDGFRCDMVHMVPLEFWQWAIANVKSRYPDIIFIAEIYDVSLYRPFIFDGGFDYLYDKVTLYDTLRGVECHNMSAANITSCWQTVEGISGHMLNFLENHDEQRFASDFYAGDAGRVRASLTVSATINTGAMMIYMGQELGERGMDAEGYSGRDGRTTIFDYWSIASLRSWLNHGACDGELSSRNKELRDFYARLLTLCNKEKALREGRFFDLMYVNYQNPGLDPHRDYAYLRATADETLMIIANFSDHDKEISVSVPRHAFNTLDLPEGTVKATELFSGEKAQKNFCSTLPFTSKVPAHGAVIWKMQNSRIVDPHAPAKPRKPRKTSDK